MRNEIRARRTELRWSQAELGKALGVSRQTVIALENDKYDPSLPLAFRISALFGAPIEEIFQPESPDGADGVEVAEGAV
ncbi:helix-turn-helix transcriptional regulator [Brachybacterium tyrofermentans]|uniref:helix-turn-helix transcriptional regulator n=1 Tax=Brachybacterium tyrofermentans TaxID=47848 RepID=UPI003FD2ABB5